MLEVGKNATKNSNIQHKRKKTQSLKISIETDVPQLPKTTLNPCMDVVFTYKLSCKAFEQLWDSHYMQEVSL